MTKKEVQSQAVSEALSEWQQNHSGAVSVQEATELRKTLNQAHKFAGEWWTMFAGPGRVNNFAFEPVGDDGLELIVEKK